MQMNIQIAVACTLVIGISFTVMFSISPPLCGWFFLGMTPVFLGAVFYVRQMRYFGRETQERRKRMT